MTDNFWENDPIVKPSAASGDRFWENDTVVKPAASAAAPATPIGDNRAATVVNLRGVPVLGGYADKGTAYLNALAAKIGIDPGEGMSKSGTISEMAAANEPIIKAAADQREQEHPIESMVGKIVAGTGALAPLGATALGAKALGLTGETLAGRTAASALSGGGLGVADAAARGDDLTKGGVTGAITAAAVPIAGQAIGKVAEGARRLVSPALAEIPSSEAIKGAAKQSYNEIKALNVQIKPEAVQNVAKEMQAQFHDDGFRDYLAPKTFGVINELAQDVPEGSVATFADLHGIRRALGKAAQSIDPTEKSAASSAISKLDNFMGNIPQADVISGDANLASQILKRANANYASAKSSELLQGKVSAAELQAGSANSGANLDNALRQRVKDLLKSPKQKQGFTQNEIIQMQRIVRGTAPANVVRALGNLLGGGGGLGSIVTASAGAMAAGPMGLAAPIAGTVVKKIGNRMTESQLNRLDEMIRARAPHSAQANLIRQAAQEAMQRRLAAAQTAGAIASRAAIPALDARVHAGQP